ncbi:MAG: energy-coupling factor transporter transmembrane protein EcfT [Siculibacillus sp.]|nr:energy-coupling factor transporter transmembrane protein EcfT [Siculibacillus sp.]
MIAALARPGTSPLHRIAAAPKLAGLAIVATVLFFVDEPRLLAAAFAAALVVARSTGTRFAEIGRDLRGAAVVLAVLGLADWWLIDGPTAIAVVLRLAAIALFAHAVTMTTSTAELTEVLERIFGPAERLGLLDAARAALTVTLALRFVPLIVEEANAIREAQAARGLDASPLALAVPLMVRVIVRSEALADAIDARGFPPEGARRGAARHIPARPPSP